MKNYGKTFMLMAIMTIIFVLVGGSFGKNGAIYGLIAAGLMNLGSYFFSDKIVLAMQRAKVISKNVVKLSTF